MSRPKLTEFRHAVRIRVESIPPGKVVTYADIGGSSLARVGGAMAHLVRHFDPELPWHRVVSEKGSLSTAATDSQRRKLHAEGVEFRSNGRVDLRRSRWTKIPFKPVR